MADTNPPGGKRLPARALAEQALQAELAGDEEKAESLLEKAEQIDPDAVLAVLQERTTTEGS